MYDAHAYYGQPSLMGQQQFLPQGSFGGGASPFSPQGAFGPWGQSLSGWPGQGGSGHGSPQGLFGGQLGPFGIGGGGGQGIGQGFGGYPQQPGFLPQAQFGGSTGQQLGGLQQLGQPPFGYPSGGWPGQPLIAFITPQGLVAILPAQLVAQLGQQLGAQFGAPAGRPFQQPYQTPQMAYA